MDPNTKQTTLIAAWPGMGSVSVIAAGYLIENLSLKEAGELPARGHFDIERVAVQKGLLQPVRLPRGLFFRRGQAREMRDLVVFLAESQPAAGAYSYAQELMEVALSMGVTRVVTFASLASAMHPSSDPKVAGVATDPGTLELLTRAEVGPMEDGEIGGMNGVLLAAASERRIPAFCLLAEIPYFAVAVPNPKAARAALSVFSVLTGIDVSLDALDEHAKAVDRALVDAYERLRKEGAIPSPEEISSESADEPEAPKAERAEGAAPEPAEQALDYAARQRIEKLFEEARQDISRAGALKQELDRLGAFRRYENRFLDLFRRAG